MEPEVKKPNRLVILGNGFDLSLDMKTSYKNFLYNYLRNTLISIYSREPLEGRKDDISTGYITYNDGLTSWEVPRNGSSYVSSGMFSEYDNYDKLSKQLIDKNLLYYEFELLREFHENSINSNWTDIEILYYDSIVKIIKDTENISNREDLLKKYNKKFNKLRLELIKYLSGVKLPWDEEKTKDLYRKKTTYYCSDFFHKITEPNDVGIPIENIMVLNFNYTPTIYSIKRYFGSIKNSFQINNIHGDINNQDSVIFGFGDELDKDYLMLESERSSELFRYIKSPHYFQSPRYKELNKFINNGEYEVYILGHSCGISDRTLLNEIFENEDCKSIRIFYHEREDLSNNKLDISIEIMKHFTNKPRMRKIIKDFTDDDKMIQLKL